MNKKNPAFNQQQVKKKQFDYVQKSIRSDDNAFTAHHCHTSQTKTLIKMNDMSHTQGKTLTQICMIV